MVREELDSDPVTVDAGSQTVTAHAERTGAESHRSARPLDLPSGVADRLTLLERIGSGGMGEVWRARDEVLGRDVAVKLLRPGRGSPKLAARLEREARAIARLRHPAIVTIHDIGRDDDGLPYLVMELLEGIDLGRLLVRVGRLPAVTAVQTMLPVLEALELAHGAEVIHRDLKPENVFIAEDPMGRRHPKLLDFGIAGVGAEGGHTAEIIGTPEYMAPEQLRVHEPVGPAADQWAAAMTLYALAEGSPPFASTSPVSDIGEIFARIREAPLPFPRSGAIDGPLFRILARATRKAPADRFASMAALADALRTWLEDRGEQPRSSQLPRPRGHQGETRPAPSTVKPAHESGVSPKQADDTPSLDDAIRESLLGGSR